MGMPLQLVYAPEQPPKQFTKAIFLAGPSPRNPTHPNWRIEALKILTAQGYDGAVFIPLTRNGTGYNYDAQVNWETECLNLSDVIAFWVPRDMESLPGLTTNVEFGLWCNSGKAVLGYPTDAEHMRYLAYHAGLEGMPVHETLEDTLRAAVKRIGEGATRVGGERNVPIHIWNLPHFQNWFRMQKAAGNRLDGAKLLWSFRTGPKKSFTFCFALKVDVHVAIEGRNKTNEIILSRPDVSSVIAYRRGASYLDTEVVLVREFRSPASTMDGMIHEVPSGSSKVKEDELVVASHELEEEAGLVVDPTRLRRIGSRQLCGTFSTHQAQVYACELTEEEMAALRQQSQDGVMHGVVGDSEQTYVEIRKVRDLCESNDVDWSCMGMILTTLRDSYPASASSIVARLLGPSR